MFNELVRRFSSVQADRRAAKRFRKRFPMAWLRGHALIPGTGLEIGRTGIVFVSRDAPSGDSVDVAMDLGGRRVRARVAIQRKGIVPRPEGHLTLVAASFSGIAADDWDAVVRFCENRAEPGNKAAEELAALAGTEDNAYRLLPLKVQEAVVAELVRAGRLAPGSSAANPLLRMTYAGKSLKTHRLSVHSRRVIDGEPTTYDSVVSIDDAGNVTVER